MIGTNADLQRHAPRKYRLSLRNTHSHPVNLDAKNWHVHTSSHPFTSAHRAHRGSKNAKENFLKVANIHIMLSDAGQK
jgi:hypothetical protein